VIQAALVGVGLCAACVVAALAVGLVLSRGLEGLLGRRRRGGPEGEAPAEDVGVQERPEPESGA
jgi:hypothetical protein